MSCTVIETNITIIYQKVTSNKPSIQEYKHEGVKLNKVLIAFISKYILQIKFRNFGSFGVLS